jgi:mannose-6-phosphate isomerase-like protein (cupin superfamily)
VKKTVMAVALFTAMPALAADPPGVFVWSASELSGYGRQLAPKMNATKIATERLATFGNHFAMMAHREGDGEAELHETQTDFFVVESGSASLLVGGAIVQPRTTQPHEVRGPSIKGGERKSLAPGDIVHIPPGIPHQLFVAEGKEFTYFVIKVDGR